MIGEKIRDYRKKQKMTMRDLANKSGVSNSYISDLENGKNNKPSLDVTIKIATALGVTINDLMETEKTGLQELLEDILQYGKAKSVEEISQKTNISLDKINLFLIGGEYDPDDYDKVVNATYGSHYNYMHQCPRQVIERLGKERGEHDKALNSLYEALEYHYGNDIVKNLQPQIFIGLNIGKKEEIFYTKEEFEKFLEFMAISFSNFKFIINNLKNTNYNNEK